MEGVEVGEIVGVGLRLEDLGGGLEIEGFDLDAGSWGSYEVECVGGCVEVDL